MTTFNTAAGKTWIDKSQVIAVIERPSEKGCDIRLTGGVLIFVRETFEDVLGRLGKFTK